MPTPIGHSLAGAVVYALSTKGKDLLKSWRWLVVCMVFAAVADIDFLPALVGRIDLANRVHRGATHSLLFAMIAAGIAFCVLRLLRRPRAGWYSTVLFLCLLSHLFLDLLGKDSRQPIGVPLLWPILGKSFKLPVEVFFDLRKDTYAEIVGLHNIGVLAHEVLLFGSILLLLVLVKLPRGSKKQEASKSEGVADAMSD